MLDGLTRARAKKIIRWKRDPAAMVQEEFKTEPDRWQLKVLEAFPSQDPSKMRIAMQACAGPGKTALLAWLAWNFLLCYGEGDDHPKGAAVSITNDNLSDNLWPELSKWQQRSDLLIKAFQWTKSRVFAKAHPETWFISARSWPKTANEEEQGRVLSGLHSGYVLYLIDESGDIPLAVLKAAEQGLGNVKFGKILQAGNPTSHAGMLYVAVTNQADKWFIVRITGDPDDPDRSPRIDIKWAEEQIRLYGRDNPWVMAYILGMFPPTALNTLIGPDEVRDAMERHIKAPDYMYSQRRMGCDVARFGDDSTVIFPRQGLRAFMPAQLRNARTNEIAARMIVGKTKWKSEQEFVDNSGGWGSGVIDNMILAGVSPFPVDFSGKATDPRYFNKRSEMLFLCAEWVKKGGVLPKVDRLVAEMSASEYFFHNGKLRVVEKAQIKEKLGHSPDYFDALALTFALPEMPGSATIPDELSLLHGAGQRQSAVSEYDPMEVKV